jgi:hypothetical protein
MPNFIIEGVDLADGYRTQLADFDHSADARAWLRGYTSIESGWDLIEIYDVRGEPAERIAFWERTES